MEAWESQAHASPVELEDGTPYIKPDYSGSNRILTAAVAALHCPGSECATGTHREGII